MKLFPLQGDFGNIMAFVAENSDNHSHSSEWYQKLSGMLDKNLLPILESAMRAEKPFTLGEIGPIQFPWVSFGSINSAHLFGLDEIILFSFYLVNRGKYKNFLDLGANIGLHSLFASKIGMRVSCVEPDPQHTSILRRNLTRNGVSDYILVEGAATVLPGTLTFTRVEGNTTGSHVKGAKPDPYGDLTEFAVEGYPISDLVRGMDLVKMDVEGLEAELIESLVESGFAGFDLVAEIGSEESARKIWEVTRGTGLNLLSQKLNWSAVGSFADLPHHHSEGSVFISRKQVMTWG